MGQKTPLEDKSVTHGICLTCAFNMLQESGVRGTALDFGSGGHNRLGTTVLDMRGVEVAATTDAAGNLTS
jgi:hypothetical protein